MSNLRNRVQLIGYVGQDPEIKTFKNGSIKTARFTLATNELFKTKTGDWKKISIWHKMVAWGPLADRIEAVLTKGCLIMIEGKLNSRTYRDQEGNTRHITEVEVKKVTLLEKNETAVSA